MVKVYVRPGLSLTLTCERHRDPNASSIIVDMVNMSSRLQSRALSTRSTILVVFYSTRLTRHLSPRCVIATPCQSTAWELPVVQYACIHTLKRKRCDFFLFLHVCVFFRTRTSIKISRRCCPEVRGSLPTAWGSRRRRRSSPNASRRRQDDASFCFTRRRYVAMLSLSRSLPPSLSLSKKCPTYKISAVYVQPVKKPLSFSLSSSLHLHTPVAEGAIPPPRRGCVLGGDQKKQQAPLLPLPLPLRPRRARALSPALILLLSRKRRS